MNSKTQLVGFCIGLLVKNNRIATALPLERTRVNGQITGPISSISVTQEFTNPLTIPTELKYLFPISEDAAVTDFEFQIGKRIIRGEIQERKQAQHNYEEARKSGKQAGLLDQRRPNLFSIQLANVLPGEAITTTLRYQSKMKFQDGEYEFVIPMGITPKYHRQGSGAKAEDIDSPIALPGERIGVVEIDLSVDAGVEVGEATSPSHKITCNRLDERRFNISLEKPVIPDHDFVLRYRVSRQETRLAAWRSTGKESEFFLASILPPTLECLDSAPAAREFIFILDRSGSMSGEPIAQARNAMSACLRALNPLDTFRILLFDDMTEWMNQEPSPVTQEAVDFSDKYLSQVEGRGGTEILPALEQALSLPLDPGRNRFLVFLTDGAVSAEDEALKLVRKRIEKTRLFSFGIGPSVNRAFLRSLSSLGHGVAEFLQLTEDIENAIVSFQDRIAYPVLQDLSMKWIGAKTWDVFPDTLPDLYIGQPLEITGRLRTLPEESPTLVVTGTLQKQSVQMKIRFSAEPSNEPAIQRIWAKANVDHLLELSASGARSTDKVRTEIINLALENRLITPFTSFVAIDTPSVTQGGEPQVIEVALPLPEGLDIEGFIPSTALLASPSFGMSGAAPLPTSEPLYDRTDMNNYCLIQDNSSMRLGQTRGQRGELDLVGMSPEETLAWLARTQRVNGSWKDDMDQTAASMLAFIRNGHTSHKGHYRQQIRKALKWLVATKISRATIYLRAMVLHEIANATGAADQAEQARAAIQNLPPPSNCIENTILAIIEKRDAGIPDANRIVTMEDLILAGITNQSIPIDESGFGEKPELLQIWKAVLGM